MSEPSEILHILRYVFTASLGILLIEIQHRNRRRLEREITLRKSSEEALTSAQAQLSRHAEELEKAVADRSKDLAASVQFLRDLLYQIAHNLRAPLRAMQGFANILTNKHSNALDATARDYLAHISDASNRMDDLVHDVLQYGQLGYQQPRMEDVSLQDSVNNALYLLAYEIAKKHAKIATTTPLPQVLADRDLLNQILINLIENALKFASSERPLQINIQSEIRGPMARLSIQDNGIGIEPQHQQRIFGMFETLHPASTSNGTGIGLALVKQSIHLMNGQVGVDSALGHGSSFWIELPSASDTANDLPALCKK
jgi:signal transduction histidine kinase